ncbi:TPR repeat-containing protein [Pseudodesulfovibrio profundus]|uniref:TPR repeat-containing protein n=2 Tax=Pseudodesulfovibrio profundus TaxID=57320 RepID=A0A2C8FAR1_9BACT|nr:TPR repeat-containing protein [Pseudodesulfovibrio profundus]
MRSQVKPGCPGLENTNEPLKCVFSTVTTFKVGTGTTAKKQQSKNLWFAKQCDEDSYAIRKINPQFVPVGDETYVDRETLLSEYTPEVEIHNQQVQPAMAALNKTLAKGDKHREDNKPLSAEMEYTRALDVDETNVRAIFGLGLVYLERNDREKGLAVFDQLVAMEAAFDEDHKHLFNEFGIALRKNQLYEESIRYYTRASELTEDDENLFYNLARVFYEKNDWEHCFLFVEKALKLDPDHTAAISLGQVMSIMADDPKKREKHGKPEVPTEIAEQVKTLLKKSNSSAMMEFPTEGLGGKRV